MCSTYSPSSWECLDAQSTKCEVTKAFSVIGPLASFMALIGFNRDLHGAHRLCSCKKTHAKIMSTGFVLLGALSFLIVFAIAASNYNGAVDTTSSCGYNLASVEAVSYGPSFYLSVTAFVTSLGAAGQIITMPISPEVANDRRRPAARGGDAGTRMVELASTPDDRALPSASGATRRRDRDGISSGSSLTEMLLGD